MTSNNWITLFIASVVGVAVWIALTVPDIGAEPTITRRFSMF